MELAKVYDELYGMIEDLKKQIGSGGGGGIEINPEGAATADLEKIKKGTDIYGLNYNKNANRPQINGNLLTGNKSSKQLNIAEEMSEAAYAALSSKNENEIYFLTENAPIFTETDTVAASGIAWSEGTDPDTYEATLSYSVVDTDTTGVIGVTCDNDLITIGDPTYSTGSVSVPMICEDPTAISGDIEFVFTLEQPAGGTKIMHGVNEYATKVYSSTPEKVGKWIDGSAVYRQVIEITPAATSGNVSISNFGKLVDLGGSVNRVDGTVVYYLPLQYRTDAPSEPSIGIGAYIKDGVLYWSIYGYSYSEIKKIYVVLEYTKSA